MLNTDKNQLKDGERHGYWEQYHENGSLSIKGNYIDGIPDGLAETFYPSGQLKNRCHTKNGKIDGLYEEYFSNFIFFLAIFCSNKF